MSDAGLQVKFDNGIILHGLYYGTADIAMRELTTDITNRLNMVECVRCFCGSEEKVIIATDYGNGSHWEGTACQKCKCITSGFDPYDVGYEDGKPDWWIND